MSDQLEALLARAGRAGLDAIASWEDQSELGEQRTYASLARSVLEAIGLTVVGWEWALVQGANWTHWSCISREEAMARQVRWGGKLVRRLKVESKWEEA